MNAVWRWPLLLAAAIVLHAPMYCPAQTIFLREGFEDTAFIARGWYDNNTMKITADEHRPGGSSAALFHFPQGARTTTSGGAIRHKFQESDEIYIGYWVKYSSNFTGSNKPYHPHEFHVVTNLENDYVGPAYTHLTLYVEQNEGSPLLAIQDAANIDESHIGADLTGVTENRSVAGCNGSADAYGEGDCYQSGSVHNNGKQWKAPGIFFTDTAGPYYKNDWHHIEAYFKLNSIVDGKGIADGIIRYWYDGVALIDHDDVMLRTGQHPTMKFNQFLIAPYIGDGSPVDQTMWVDDLTLASSRPVAAVESREDAGSRDLLLYPNPARSTVTVGFPLPSRSRVAVRISDLLGRTLLTEERDLEGGDQAITISTSSLPAGTYLCTVTAPGICRRRIMKLIPEG